VTAALSALECLVVQDIFLNETAEVRTCSSRLVVPREGRHLHQC
jgi:predicted molibdopterin-dependent oxidoreductase YjgC